MSMLQALGKEAAFDLLNDVNADGKAVRAFIAKHGLEEEPARHQVGEGCAAELLACATGARALPDGSYCVTVQVPLYESGAGYDATYRIRRIVTVTTPICEPWRAAWEWLAEADSCGEAGEPCDVASIPARALAAVADIHDRRVEHSIKMRAERRAGQELRQILDAPC